MDIRNGVIHVTVSLEQIASFSPREKFYSLTHKNRPGRIYLHKSTLSLAIPSEFSPRLIQVKNNINSSKAKGNRKSAKISSTVQTTEFTKIRRQSQIYLKKNLEAETIKSAESFKSFKSLVQVSKKIDNISSKINHLRKMQRNSKTCCLMAKRKPEVLTSNLKKCTR